MDRHNINDADEDSASAFGGRLLDSRLAETAGDDAPIGERIDGTDTAAMYDDTTGADMYGPEAKKLKVEFRFVEDSEVQSEVPVNSGVHDPLDVAVGNSLIKHTDTKQFRYPWERGYLGKFFNSNRLPGLDPPSIAPGNENLVGLIVEATDDEIRPMSMKYVPKVPSASITEKVVRKTDNSSFVDERRKKRQDVVTAWWSLLCDNMDASAVGRKVSVEAPLDDISGYARAVIDASFAVKSANTLQKRLYAMRSFRSWCEEQGKLTWLPIKERDAWEYVRYLDYHEAAPTKASSFVEACRFCWYILGLSGCDAVEHSLRVRGLTSQLHCRKRPWRPADVLTTAEVMRLHAVLMDSSQALADRVVCGHLLHLLYSRSRWSDLVNVANLYIDPDQRYIELDARSHKGARNCDTKSRLLPVVGPCQGIHEVPWVLAYMEVRKACGLPDPVDVEMPMLPAPLDAEGTVWGKRYMTSNEGTCFLREVLGIEKSHIRRISTHSMKSTAISWCSKFGLNEDAKALLARRQSAVKNPQALYSRDLLSTVLRSFDQVIGAIRTGVFFPDRSRSGMVVLSGDNWQQYGLQQQTVGVPATPVYNADLQAPSTPAVGLVQTETSVESVDGYHLVKEEIGFGVGDLIEVFSSPDGEEVDELQPQVQSSGCISESSESSCEESSSEEEMGEASSSHVMKPLNTPLPNTGWYIHRQSLVLHCLRDVSSFRCGRPLNAQYIKVRELNGFRCGRCFNV